MGERRFFRLFAWLVIFISTLFGLLGIIGPGAVQAATITARVVAIDQVIVYNQWGAYNPVGMIYALARDAVNLSTGVPCNQGPCTAGNVQLRPDKRPRPLVLRVSAGDTLVVIFTNLLANPRDAIPMVINPDTRKTATPPANVVDQHDAPATRYAGFHINGLAPLTLDLDSSYVGRNSNYLAAPGETRTYSWTAPYEGTYMVYSPAALSGGEGDGGSTTMGLFGAVNVEPTGAVAYASQVTAAEMTAATIIDNTVPGGKKINSIPMVVGGEIVRSDLNAIIDVPADRTKGFREFTVIFHDEGKVVQAFPLLEDSNIFHGVRDGFSINYGSNGVGAPVLSIRGMVGTDLVSDASKAVGPAKDCKECKFEEFFLESWALGDPALQVKTAYTTSGLTYPRPPNEFLYTDDPSNVHHSYIGDPVKFRNIHAGPKETHVFHLHAHQWQHNPAGPTPLKYDISGVPGVQSPSVSYPWWADQPQGGDTNSTYLDSQSISPGSAFTYNITYGGGGNRNLGPGDSIFHCHLYPHFAQGMWELWRNHDVFEDGNRVLPDNSPIPALMPMPGRAMAPPPGTEGNPGYPFYIAGMPNFDASQAGVPDAYAGVFGHRVPQAPLDIVPGRDGGLQRHRFVGTGMAAVDGIRGPFDRVLTDVPQANIILLGAPGVDVTNLEEAAIDYHSRPAHASFTPEGDAAWFKTNGLPRAPGAPYSNPCPQDAPVRSYWGSAIDLNMVTNSKGWHDPQGRITVLDGDVDATLSGQRPPEPFFFRANSGECVVYYDTNRTKNYVDKDDFQIFTPTDILGRHIHLVKFDVTSSDGSGNGWNYEDGTYSAMEIAERIAAINKYRPPDSQLVANGYQTTTQRWWADPLINLSGQDRTIRTVFTHDHFGPSTHQQHGYYAALVVEPKGSTWWALNGRGRLGQGRADGGPTSYAANIITPDSSQSYREFMLAIADFALLYDANGNPINRPDIGPGVSESISAHDPGSMLLNYRHEPIPLRVSDGVNQIKTQTQRSKGDKGNLANVFDSKVQGDPFTPILQAYQGDKVQIRMIQGAQEEQHVFSVHGVRWLHEPADPSSPYYNAQSIGISEHFEFAMDRLPMVNLIDCTDTVPGTRTRLFCADYWYGSTSLDDVWNGAWGILRSFGNVQPNLGALPNNQPNAQGYFTSTFDAVPTVTADKIKRYNVVALAKPIVYNSRPNADGKIITDPTGLIFALAEDVAATDNSGKLVLTNGMPTLNATKVNNLYTEPLVLRANAGDRIEVTLSNLLPTTIPDLPGDAHFPKITQFNVDNIRSANQVGFHPQLVNYNPVTSDGANVGLNRDTTVGPGQKITYYWYAGKVDQTTGVGTPIEFGATNIRDYGDIMKHGSQGLFAGLVIEPQGAVYLDSDTLQPIYGGVKSKRNFTKASIRMPDGSWFREFVVFYQDGLNLRLRNASDPTTGDSCITDREVAPGEGAEVMCSTTGELDAQMDAEDAGEKAFNYRTEPFWYRLGYSNQQDRNTIGDRNDLWKVLSNEMGGNADPQTPIFEAFAGDPVRFRLLQPDGRARMHAFTIHGHGHPHEPGHPTEFYLGTQGGMSVMRHFNLHLIDGAGGANKVTGDWLYRDQPSFQFPGGLWGILRVNTP